MIATRMASKSLSCAICGDKAKCSYFGAISCESCKVFFRRAVQDGMNVKYSCVYDGTCTINIRTRKLCQRCRFQKCLSEGMKTNWVKLHSHRSNSDERKTRKQSANVSHWESVDERKGSDAIPGGGVTSPGFVSFESTCTVVHVLSVDDHECIRQAVDNTSRTIKEIPFPDKAYVERPDFPHIVNVFAIVVRRITAFAKTFREFRELEINDQLSLLKGATLEVMMTRKATTILYKKTKKGFVWMVEDDKYLLSQDDLKHAYDRNLYESHMNYILSLMNLKVDDTTLVLLTCVILFSPDHEELIDVKKVEKVQSKYVHLLEKYLHCTFGCVRGRKLFPKLLVLMCKAHEASYNYNKSVLETSKEQIEPIMKEFFDMV